jgi:hypothetical protein
MVAGSVTTINVDRSLVGRRENDESVDGRVVLEGAFTSTFLARGIR